LNYGSLSTGGGHTPPEASGLFFLPIQQPSRMGKIGRHRSVDCAGFEPAEEQAMCGGALFRASAPVLIS